MRIPVGIMIVLIVFSILVDLYILWDIRTYCRARRRRMWMGIQSVTAVICWIFLLVILLMPKRDADSGIQTLMWLLYGYVSIYIPKFIYVVFSVIGRLVAKIGGKCFNYCIIGGAVLAVVVFCAMWWGALVTRRQIDVKRVVVTSDRLPDNFNGMKIVQISDLHTGTWGNDTTFVSTLVDSVNSLKPDVIFFTGDIVNRETKELEPFLPVLARLKAPHGVYSILGNHDYGDYISWKDPSLRENNNRLLEKWEKDMGWKLLNNEHTYIVENGDSITLIGVENWGEPPFKQYGKLRDSYRTPTDSVRPLLDDRYKILLTHNPEHWSQEVTKVSNIDLSLSGHTHAMQMAVSFGPWTWSPAKYKYEQWGGLFEKESPDGRPMNLYVNIGSGEVGIPARIGSAKPEITLITLNKK